MWLAVHENYKKEPVVRLVALFPPLGVALLGILLAASAPAPAANKLQVGDDPPDKFGKSASGDRIHLADYQGKLVVISFWASWCSPCRKELPMMIELQKIATRERLIVLSVNWQQPPDQFRVIREKLKEFDLTLISDPYGAAGRAYDVTAIPHMVIVGKDGKVAAIHVGYSEDELPALVDEINGLLAKDLASH